MWSSNNSVQQLSASDYHEEKGRPAMMNNMDDHDDVIGSLGKVLSSVNLAGDGSAHGGVGGGNVGKGNQGVYGAPGTKAVGGSNPGSWTGLSGSAAPAPSG